MLHKPSLMLFGALTASLMLGACNQKPDAGAAAPDSAQSSEAASDPAAAAVVATDPSAVASTAEIPEGCRILSSANWVASVSAQPPGLVVSGKVETATGGFEVGLERKDIDPKTGIASLELQVAPPPADAMVSQMITPHDLKVEVPDAGRALKSVVINCGGAKLAEIAVPG